MRTAVVGAGLAGLTAAVELQRAGADVAVFEARDRLGGRVWSEELDNGAIVERGAEFLLPGNTAVRELAESCGLGLWDKGMRYGEREPRGAATSTTALAATAESVGRALRESDPDVSARSFLAQLDIGAGEREALIARVEISSANSADVVAARDLTSLAHIDYDPAPSIAGGNSRLALALAGELGAAVRLSSPVESITWTDDGARVWAAGAELEADACVVAVPASVLGGIRFDPALPGELAEALGGIRMGQAAKLFVPLRGAPPPSAVMSVPERYWCWTATGPEATAQPVVSCFAGSSRALERLDLLSGPQRWLDSLAALRPDLELDPARAVLSTWADDPWVRGAYSTSPAIALASVSEQPVGPLAFAGEHLGGEFAALMEGAIRSGRQAARSLLAAVRTAP
jgi:monoamine oxidase